MSHPLRFLRRRNLALGALLPALTLLAASSFAQLTAEDIARMQQQAAREGWTFKVSQNEATQYPLEQLCGLKEPPGWRDSARFVPFDDKGPLRPRFDWRETAGGLPPVRNQGSCGSCWAFGTVGPLECNIKIQDGDIVDLSEQWLVSCNRMGWGCDGGWFAHEYHRWSKDACDSSGAVLEQDYPYTASDAPCACPDPHPYKIRDWAFIDSQSGVPSVGAMKLAIYEHGPISVALAVTSPFHAYSGGVFNACSEGTINHAVTLVGWDDTMGDYGVWILRNSWGPGWGDNGYMYIAYGCLQVGYGACYVEYYGGVSFSADVQSGWGPLTVNFSGRSGLNLTDWSWDFGDGHTGAGQYTAHTYTTPGSFTVTVSAYDSLGGLRQISKPGFIAALADTVRPAHLAGSVNSVIQVPVCIRNNAPVQSITLPLTYGGPVDLVLDSWSTEGCRTDYFASVAPTYSHPEAKQATLLLLSSTDGSQPFLPPGEGPILKLYFSIPPQGNYGQVTPLDVSGYLQFSPIFHSPTLDWNPVPLAGSVTLLAQPGDCDGRTGLTIGDVTFLVGFLFRGGPAPDPAEAGDVDCSGAVGIGDITKLVAYMFRDGPAPVMCE